MIKLKKIKSLSIRISKRRSHQKGEILEIIIDGKVVHLIITSHARERAKKWGIQEKRVAETLLLPEEVLKGHGGRFIAQRRYGDHVLRTVYEYEHGKPVLVTVYFPLAKRYFLGGGHYEDKILARCRRAYD